MTKTKNKVNFCWICSKKLWGGHREVLTIDMWPRTLHKMCAKEVKREMDYKKDSSGAYHSMEWVVGY